MPLRTDEQSFIASQQELLNISDFVDYTPPKSIRELDLEPFCRAMDRTDIRSRAASLLITEAFRSVGLHHLVVGRAKIRAELKKARNKAVAAAAKNNLLKCISFDGKKNKTLKTLPGTSTNRIEDEEQVVLVKQPGSQYMGYVAPQRNGKTSSSALPTATAILNFLRKENYNLDFLVALACDGTSCNTGHKGGIIQYLEAEMERPLQWIICLFHFNELPLEAVYRFLMGSEKEGPNKYAGQIGTEMHTCETMPVRSTSHLVHLIKGFVVFHAFFSYLSGCAQFSTNSNGSNARSRKDPKLQTP